MANNNSRADLQNWCLRQLGEPVIKVNVADEQISDRIDEAIRFWQENHIDGSVRGYYMATVQADGTITVPSDILSVSRIVNPKTQSQTSQFTATWQMMNEVYLELSRSAGSNGQKLTHWEIAGTYLSTVKNMFEQRVLVEFNQLEVNNILDETIVHVLPNDFEVGDTVVVEAYKRLNPEIYTKAFSDHWLCKYTAALIKQQWGSNLKKYDGMQMLGGVTFNGQAIFDEAKQEIAELEDELTLKYQKPAAFFMG